MQWLGSFFQDHAKVLEYSQVVLTEVVEFARLCSK